MNKIQSFENFLNESLRPDELESQVRDITFLFRQHNRGVKGKHSDNQIVDFMKKYGWIQKLTSKQKDEVFDLVKKNLNEALRPDELESLAKDLAYSMPNHTKYDESEGPSDKQIMDAMKKYQKDLYQHSTKKQKDEVLDIVKKILNESSINEAARSNEALKYVTSKYKDDRVNSVTFDELLVPLANHLDDYADRMMGDLEYSKKTFAAFKSLVDLMTADHIESDKYN